VAPEEPAAEFFFTDIPNSKAYRIGLDGAAVQVRDNTQGANGQAFGPDGQLYVVADDAAAARPGLPLQRRCERRKFDSLGSEPLRLTRFLFMRSALRFRLTLLALCLLLTPAFAQSARLANISTRGQVGVGADNLFGGFVVAGGPKTVLVRAIGPGLAAFGVAGTLADPQLQVFSGQAKVAENDDWLAADSASFAQVGAFPLPAGSKDAVVVATLQPGAYTAQISGLGAANTGVAILEVYDLGGSGQLVNIATRLAVGTGANAAVAGFVVAPGAGTRKLLVRGVGPALAGFGLAGTLPDPKLTVLDAAGGEVAVASANGNAGALTAAAGQAGAFAATATDTAVIVNVAPGSYTAQLAGLSGTTSGVALIEVYDITNSTGTPPAFGQSPRLFFANLRGGAAGSTASGYATVLFDPNTNTATVSASFSNLSSAQTGAHLVLGSGAGTYVLNLPRGQVAGMPWSFAASGPYSGAAIVAALLNGEIAVQIETAGFPGGELRSNLAAVRGSTAFAAPPAPPALPAGLLATPSDVEAARFLTQATFGPTLAAIASLRARGIPGWIDDQLALPATSALALLNADVRDFPNPPTADPNLYTIYTHWNWHPAWWKLVLASPDQLRQRVAFALSELLVVGNAAMLPVKAKVRYYDLLVAGAFGNYRQLLDDVTLSPVMGTWLSHRGNQKANPVTGAAPDENYAREVMQLFTIGLVQLQPDGTLLLDASGQPIPTYNQAMVSEMAKVMTGWSFADYPADTTSVRDFTNEFSPHPDNNVLPETIAWLNPMRYYDAFHDKTAKRLVSLQQRSPLDASPTPVPAGQTGPQDLKVALDALFQHPNTGPFIGRHLIKFLVTSNPSPGYVHRVARVFADDGTGTRGNLGAVVRAILTDYEARSPAVLANIGYGKIKEPLLRFTAFFRALNARAPNGRFLDSFFGDPRSPDRYLPIGFMSFPLNQTGQQPLYARSVFNFFSPTYSPPGPLAAGGLVAPELEITDGNFAISIPNTFTDYIYRTAPPPVALPSGPSPFLSLDFSDFLPLARNPAALVDRLDLVFCGGQMPAATRTRILGALQSFAGGISDDERVRNALHLTVVSPAGATQK
jgi:uncharacterized protein (DUF1800 family)